MRLLIWGAGAIGGTVGAFLARAGHEVTLVDRVEEHVAAIQARGLSITGPVADFNVSVPAYTPENLTGIYEHILLCVKAHHTEEALLALLPNLSEWGYVASLQNGLNELVIAKHIGRERTIGAFINFGADYIEPGVIHMGNRAAVVVGELDGLITPRLKVLHTCLRDFEPDAMLTSNIFGYLWGKLAYGTQLFATALTNDSIADALAQSRYRLIYIQLAQEVLSIAHNLNITPEGFNGFNPLAFLPDTPRAVSEQSLDAMVAFNRPSAKTHSGIWRDLAVRKRKTEVDAQLGIMVKIAQERGIKTPLLSCLIDRIHDIENGTLPQGEAALESLLALVKG